MSVDFESIEGGSLAAFLNTPLETPAAPVVDTPVVVEPAQEQVPAVVPAVTEPNTPAPVATPDATIVQEPNPDAVKEGTADSADKSASPDAQQQEEEAFKEPKALRAAYDNLKSETAPYKPFIDKVREKEVSPVMLDEAFNTFDSYLSLDSGETSASPFLSNLYQISPTAFQRVIQTLIEDNKEFVSNQVFGTNVTAEDVEAFKKFKESGSTGASNNDEIVVPEFDPVSGEPLSEEIQSLIRDNIVRARTAEAARASSDAQTASEKTAAELAAQQEAAAKREIAIDTAIQTYRDDRLKVIDTTIANLRLQPVPTDTAEVKTEKEMMASVIKGATVFSFGSDAKAQALYRQALDNIGEGKDRLAAGLAFNIEKAMGEHAAKVGKFISDLYAKAHATVAKQVQQAATGDRPEISNTGAAPSIGTSASSHAPLSSQSIDARLAELEASGRFRS